MVQTRRAFKQLRKVVTQAEVETLASLGFCVRPSRELGALQSEVHKLYGYGEAARCVIPRSSITLGKSATAVALYYGSSIGLEYRSHRFTFVGDGLDYHREPFNVDCQSIGSRAIELSGLAAIATEPAARLELLWLSESLEGVRPNSWVNEKTRTVTC
ncbi:hypothetical protein H7Y63_00915 [Polaromonas sp.]|nr:hypothetical protein [Candidatus Saccharibacteria bacterium]